MVESLVLLHGFTHTGASWDPVRAALAERYRGLAPDLRGHGAASDVRPVSLEAVIGDVAELPVHRFTLVGYSMGGRVALHVALALAGRVQRLVLIGASPGLADPAEREARAAADERLALVIERSTIERFARRWADATPVLAGQPASIRENVHRDRLRNTPAGLAAALRGLGTGTLPPLWERLGELDMPATLIVGARDEKFTAIAREMVEAIPDADLALVPDAGHAAHLEAPEATAAIIAPA
jgi:2-succinyl-6-hydroxy-2,4-cyclohexadiene-1-carboxylate synthase